MSRMFSYVELFKIFWRSLLAGSQVSDRLSFGLLVIICEVEWQLADWYSFASNFTKIFFYFKVDFSSVLAKLIDPFLLILLK